MSLNSDRLRLLRQFHDKTQAELAELVSVSQPTIADYEAGHKEPQSEILEALAVVLRVEPQFFFTSDEDMFAEEEYNFRRRLTATERLKKKVIAQASLFGMLVRAIRRHVPTMPKFNVPSFPATTLADVEHAAEAARKFWGLGTDGPIDSMVDVLESAGIVLTVADVETAEKVDAFSRYGLTSVVVLNNALGSPSRSFFDTAHEAGHGVLHYKQPLKPLDVREEEAQRFAGAFLMPRKPFLRDFWSRGSIDWNNLLEMKSRWGTSLSALLVRAYQLGLIDAVVYRQAFRQLSYRGWRTSEPGEPVPETPRLFTLALHQFEKRTKRTLTDFISEMSIKPTLFTAVAGIDLKPSKVSGVVSLADRRDAARKRSSN